MTDLQPDDTDEVCGHCGDPLSDHVEVVATDYDGPRCGDCAEYRPPEPPAPTLGTTEEAERNCSASLPKIIFLTERRLRRAA